MVSIFHLFENPLAATRRQFIHLGGYWYDLSNLERVPMGIFTPSTYPGNDDFIHPHEERVSVHKFSATTVALT
jgi:hypothetical protein